MREIPPRQSSRDGGGAGRVWLFAATAVVVIWLAVLLAGLYSPETPSSSLGVLGIRWLDLLWGVGATGFVVAVAVYARRFGAPGATPWMALSIAGALVWAVTYGIAMVGTFVGIALDLTVLALALVLLALLAILFDWLARKIEGARHGGSHTDTRGKPA